MSVGSRFFITRHSLTTCHFMFYASCLGINNETNLGKHSILCLQWRGPQHFTFPLVVEHRRWRSHIYKYVYIHMYMYICLLLFMDDFWFLFPEQLTSPSFSFTNANIPSGHQQRQCHFQLLLLFMDVWMPLWIGGSLVETHKEYTCLKPSRCLQNRGTLYDVQMVSVRMVGDASA